MAAEFIVFKQTDKRLALRWEDISDVAEAGTGDDDQRIVLTVKGKPVRVDESFDEALDRLNR
jgi:hypothetical protein